VTAFLQAVGFLTVLPVGRRAGGAFRPVAAVYFALVGLIIGALLAAADLALAVFPAPLRAILLVAAWLLLTGALHLDGWIDACDALAPGLSRARARSALQDPRAGALGVGGAVVLLGTKAAALASIAEDRALWIVLATVASRWAVVMLLVLAPAAGGGDGLGARLAAGLGARHALLPCLTLAAVLPLVPPLVGAAVVAVVTVASGVVAGLLARRIGYLNGDGCGAAIELSEACVLLLAAAGVRA
jgi:adenosylcobinamide-GDP ribazoletransferase